MTPPKNIDFVRSGTKYRIDLTNDFYGESFWSEFAQRLYEPDTQSLVEAFCGSNTTFLDIGAATGAMSLLASSLGSNVLAFEPNPNVFAVLSRNIELNQHLPGKISASQEAVSTFDGFLDLKESKSGKEDVLSPIVFTNWSSQDQIKVVSLKRIIEQLDFHQAAQKQLVIKMDVEGAEWQIFQDIETIIALAKSRAIVILAIHPGLHRPLFRINGIRGRFFWMIWTIRNCLEFDAFYRKVITYAKIKKTNLQSVRRKLIFILLSAAGNHEYVIDFRSLE